VSRGLGVTAVKMAGYGTPSSSRQSLAQLAYQLNCDPKIQAAIAEISQQNLTLLGPLALRALEKLLNNPLHRDHGRALGIVVAHVAPQAHILNVKHEHEIGPNAMETAQILQRIAVLSAKFSVRIPAP